MKKRIARRGADRQPTHPGEFLAEEILPSVALSKAEIARLLGISPQRFHDITSGRKPVSPRVAVRLGELFGNGPELWLRMQGAHDLWRRAPPVEGGTQP